MKENSTNNLVEMTGKHMSNRIQGKLNNFRVKYVKQKNITKKPNE